MNRTFFFIIIALIIAIVLAHVSYGLKAKSEGKSVYTITVYNFGVAEGDTYITDSIISQDGNKIMFFDMLGRKQTVSGSGITVTQY